MEWLKSQDRTHLKKIKNKKSFFWKELLHSWKWCYQNGRFNKKNAYHNTTKYIAEVNQRVHSLKQYADNHNLKPIFGTITLPSQYHRLIGNKRRNPKYRNRHLLDESTLTYCPYSKKNRPIRLWKILSKWWSKRTI